MERKDLLSANGAIFGPQGRAIAQHASPDVRVLVVGNPANTNCLIAAANAARPRPAPVPRHDPARPQPRARRGSARRPARTSTTIRRMTIWGNHSSTQFPDIAHATVGGQPAAELVDEAWYRDTFIPTVQQRGAAIIKARGASSAGLGRLGGHGPRPRLGARARRRATGCRWRCPPTAATAIAPGVVYSYPCVCKNGDYEIVQGLEHGDFSRARAWRPPKPSCARSAPRWKRCCRLSRDLERARSAGPRTPST